VRVLGTGRESRDFVHARDVAHAVACVAAASGAASGAARTPVITPLRPGNGESVYNLGSGQETTVAALVQMLEEELGCRRPVTFTNEQPPGYPTNWRADISRLAAIGFRPRVELRAGIAEYCRWFRSTVGAGGLPRQTADARRVTAASGR
jgi:UDP-glucose 4-epimerase